MSDQGHSRIAAARQRALGAKRRLAVAAVATFTAVFGLAWASHPGSSSASATPAVTSDSSDDGSVFEQDDDVGGFSSLAPSGSAAPQVQTHVS